VLDSFGIGKRKLLNRIITENWDVPAPELKNFSYNELIFLLQEMTEQEGKKYFEGEGSPHRGFIMFRKFVELLFYRNMANYDSMLLLTGDKGVGKSSVALVIAREWCKYLGVPFTPEKYFAYNNNEVIAKIDSLDPFSCIICDESVRFACITGDSIITIKVGGEINNVPIRSLEGQEDVSILSHNIKTKRTEFKRSKICKRFSDDEVFTIETSNGNKLTATARHWFLTEHGWKQLKDLKNDEKLWVC